MDEYSKKEKELEAERNYELAKESFQELTGLEPGDLTLDQMKDMMYEIEGVKTDSESDKKTLYPCLTPKTAEPIPLSPPPNMTSFLDII